MIARTEEGLTACLATILERICFGTCQNRLHKFAEFFCLRKRSFNTLVQDERRRHVLQHRFAVRMCPT